MKKILSEKALTYIPFEYPLTLERDNHQTTVHVVCAVDQQVWQQDGGFAIQLIQIHPATGHT